MAAEPPAGPGIDVCQMSVISGVRGPDRKKSRNRSRPDAGIRDFGGEGYVCLPAESASGLSSFVLCLPILDRYRTSVFLTSSTSEGMRGRDPTGVGYDSNEIMSSFMTGGGTILPLKFT